MFFLYKRMSLAGISQSPIDSFGMAFTFLLADSSADEARARGGRRVDVGDDDTDRDDLEGLFVLLAVFAAAAATAAAMVVAKLGAQDADAAVIALLLLDDPFKLYNSSSCTIP